MNRHPWEPAFIEYIWPSQASQAAPDHSGLLNQVLNSEDALFRDPLAESGGESER